MKTSKQARQINESKEIFVIDDDPNFVIIKKSVIESKGYKVIAAYDREEVLKVLKKCRPDLILLEADDFMEKPVAPATLLGRIDKLLRG